VNALDPTTPCFPADLAAALVERGLSKTAFAERLGVSKNTVTNWTRGHVRPTLAHLRAIEALLVDDRSSTSEELRPDQADALLHRLSEAAPDLLGLLRDVERYVERRDRGSG